LDFPCIYICLDPTLFSKENFIFRLLSVSTRLNWTDSLLYFLSLDHRFDNAVVDYHSILCENCYEYTFNLNVFLVPTYDLFIMIFVRLVSNSFDSQNLFCFPDYSHFIELLLHVVLLCFHFHQSDLLFFCSCIASVSVPISVSKYIFNCHMEYCVCEFLGSEETNQCCSRLYAHIWLNKTIYTHHSMTIKL
jgi:hypothetical protein